MSLIWNRTHAWDDADWRSNAACRDTEPELFFPIGTTGMATDQIESAKRVCCNCDAAKFCLEFALATNQESGVWGGWPLAVARRRTRVARSSGPRL
jgi:WhiB family redox-sensing transcriptional regulator